MPRQDDSTTDACGRARLDDEELARGNNLWSQVRIDAEWVEFYPSLQELAASADAAVVGRLVAVKSGNVVQGDAAEDLYAEVTVRADVIEVLRDSTTEDVVTFSLGLPSVANLGGRDATIASAEAAFPINNVVLFLRWRDDRPYYRLVNGFGIWAATTRSPVDAPILPDAPSEERTVFDHELDNIDCLEELIEHVR